MGKRTKRQLQDLERIRDQFDTAAVGEKKDLLDDLATAKLATADEVHRLHEVLSFLRAYPADRPSLRRVDQSLLEFAERKDLGRFREELADTGIAGTRIYFRFYWFTALWLVEKWPHLLSIDWKEFNTQENLEKLLHLILPFSETPTLDDSDALTLRELIDLLRGPDETDAVFIVNRFKALVADSFGRETIYEQVDAPMVLEPKPGTPSRTLGRYKRSPVFYQTQPLRTGRPSFPRDIHRPPIAVENVSVREGKKLIDLAREAMISRARDLDIFVHADPHDVRMIDCGEGLQFACFGAIPERRLMFDAIYGCLTLKSGVPIGYVLSGALFGSIEVAYNVFEAFRGGESGYIYGRVLAMLHHLFECDAFVVDPYQLGYENEEGLKSGAWWFYYKLGFRPHDPDIRALMNRELKKMRRKPGHRSNRATLHELASGNMYYHMGKERADVLGRLSTARIGEAVSRYLAGRFGSNREKGMLSCSREAADLLGVSSFSGFSKGEKLAWKRWSPVVLVLPGVKKWTDVEKAALVAVIRAKGGVRESEFVRLFDHHRRLRRALAKLGA